MKRGDIPAKPFFSVFTQKKQTALLFSVFGRNENNEFLV